MSKKNRRALRRSLLTLSLVLVVAFAAVGGTIAWLTSTTGTVTNTFSVGDVKITLDETDVDVYGVKDGETPVMENAYKLLPGHNYIKDPTVHVQEASEACYVYVTVVNGIVDIEAEENTIAAQIAAKGWNALTGVANTYWQVLDRDAAAAGPDLKVFEEFTIADDADVSSYNGATVTIKAYAIQQDGFEDANAAWTALQEQENKQ